MSTSILRLVLTVSVERFIGIRSPVHAHFKWKEKGVLLIIVPIFIGAFVITFYHHIAYKYSIYTVCNGTQLKGNVRPVCSLPFYLILYFDQLIDS